MPADLGSSMRFQPTALLDALVIHETCAFPLTQMRALCFVTASLLVTTKAVAIESSSYFDFFGPLTGAGGGSPSRLCV